jgi:ABC-2 type transport system permease protein
MKPRHAAQALFAIVWRETAKFIRQRGRLISALVRPALWLLVFAAGVQTMSGNSITGPDGAAVPYQLYIVPGLVGMVLLFNGIQSSLALVYDREMGMMRLLLTAPLPRWYLLLCKLLAGVALSTLQAYAFLLLCAAFRIGVPWIGWLTALPAILATALMLGAIGLLLSVYIRELENFAGTMNFLIFPMFFISSALYPLARLSGVAADILWWAAALNPFTHGVETIRQALDGRLDPLGAAVVLGVTVAAFIGAVYGFDPQRGMFRRAPPA